jgi:hypothetical protein
MTGPFRMRESGIVGTGTLTERSPSRTIRRAAMAIDNLFAFSGVYAEDEAS